MNDIDLIDGIIENTDFISIQGNRDAIEAALTPASERTELDEMMLTLNGLESTRQAEQREREAAEAQAALEAQREAERREREANACTKCGGSGHLSHYWYVDNGTCFRCMGTGTRF